MVASSLLTNSAVDDCGQTHDGAVLAMPNYDADQAEATAEDNQVRAALVSAAAKLMLAGAAPEDHVKLVTAVRSDLDVLAELLGLGDMPRRSPTL